LSSPQTSSPSQNGQDEDQIEDQPSPSTKMKSKWAEKLLKEAREQVSTPKTSVRTCKPPERYPGYATLMSHMIESEPTNFEEAIKKHGKMLR